MMKQHKFNSAQYEANIAALPELCYSVHPSDNTLVILKRGEKGFYPVDPAKWPAHDGDTREAQCRRANDRMGVKTADRMAMEIGSMAGFDVPGADPEKHRSAALAEELEDVNDDLAAECRTMMRAGATYDEIKARFKAIINAAEPLRAEAR